MDPSDLKEIFILLVLFFAILCVIFHTIEFFGCLDCCKDFLCKRSINQINVEDSQRIP